MNSILTQGFSEAYRDPVTSAYPLGNGYRFYLPALMRFSAQDAYSPFGKGGVHAYGYCAADPINLKDPSGHDFLGGLLSLLDPVHDINQYILKPLGVKLPQWAQTVERVTRDVATTVAAIAAVPFTDGASVGALVAAGADLASGAMAIGADVTSSFQSGGAAIATQVLSYGAMVTGSGGIGVEGVSSFVRSADTSVTFALSAEQGLRTTTEEGATEAFRSSAKVTPRSSFFARAVGLGLKLGVPPALGGAGIAERLAAQSPPPGVIPDVEAPSPELPSGDPNDSGGSGGSGNPNKQSRNQKQRRLLTGAGSS